MHAFSAADLISPAIKRTRWFLFQPFRWGTFLKLCLVSVLTEGYGGFNGNFSVPGGHHNTSPSPHLHSAIYSPLPSYDFAPWLIALFAAIMVVAIGISLVIFYLVTRLRFALFHCLVFQTREIRPGWRRYDTESWRFFLLCIAVGFAFFISMLLIAIPFVIGFWHLSQTMQPGESFNFAGLLALLLPLIPIILLIVVAAIAVHVILHDLMLPHIALENASVSEAWRAARTRIAAEKGGFLLYAVLRVVLPMVASVAAIIALMIPVIILAVVIGISAAGLSGLFAEAAAITKLIMILALVIAVCVLIAVAIFIWLCVGGPIGIATRNYALLFYGGRYQVLGDLMSPPPPPPLIESAPATV